MVSKNIRPKDDHQPIQSEHSAKSHYFTVTQLQQTIISKTKLYLEEAQSSIPTSYPKSHRAAWKQC
jgi:hypothetical protein